MALPSSGPLSINDIAAEFGGSTPHSLSEYYNAAPGIPASGTIAIDDFYGASSPLATYSLTSDTSFDYLHGYQVNQYGSLSPTDATWLPQGISIRMIRYNEGSDGTREQMSLYIDTATASVPNSGWEYMYINGVLAMTRSLSMFRSRIGVTRWDHMPSGNPNPFPTDGATYTVTIY